jgi:hypothetical protein
MEAVAFKLARRSTRLRGTFAPKDHQVWMRADMFYTLLCVARVARERVVSY